MASDSEEDESINQKSIPSKTLFIVTFEKTTLCLNQPNGNIQNSTREVTTIVLSRQLLTTT